MPPRHPLLTKLTLILVLTSLSVLGLFAELAAVANGTTSDKLTTHDTEALPVVDITPELNAKISAVIAQTSNVLYSGNYEQSLKQLQALKKLAPDHPISYAYEAVIYYLIIVDFRNFAYTETMLDSIQQTIKLGKRWKRQHKNQASWAHFYMGVAYGIRGLHHATYDNYIRAFADGVRGYRYMSMAATELPDLYDTRYGIGLYNYWYAKILGRFMLRAERERMKNKGINDLKEAYTKGTLIKTFAGIGLVEIYQAENRLTEAQELAHELLSNYPEFPNIYANIAYLYANSKPPQAAITVYSQLREKIAANVYVAPLSYLIIDRQLALAYCRKGATMRCREILESIVSASDLQAALKAKIVPEFMRKHYTDSQKLLTTLQ